MRNGILRRSIWLGVALLAIAGCGGAGGGGSGDAQTVSKEKEQVIVKFKRTVARGELARGLEEKGFHTTFVSTKGGFRTVEVPEGWTVEEAVEYLQSSGAVEYAEPDQKVSIQYVPNDPLFPLTNEQPGQWSFTQIGVEAAWDTMANQLGAMNRGGARDVVVAVLDTGVAYQGYFDPEDPDNPDDGTFYHLGDDYYYTSFSNGWDFVNDDSHPNDDHGHGTHIAGIIAESTDTEIPRGAAGIAYNTTIMPVKVLNANGDGSHSQLASGILWAVDHGAEVINLSLGGPLPSQTLYDALVYAREHDVVVLAAAGNQGIDDPTQGLLYPAKYNDMCISVGATTRPKQHAAYSNEGPELDLVAPGGDITYGGILQQSFNPGFLNTFTYQSRDGTSQATAHVSAAAAMMRALGIVSPEQIESLLIQTVEDRGDPGHDPTYGHGLIHIGDAVALAAVTTPDPANTQYIVIDDGDPGTSRSGQWNIFNYDETWDQFSRVSVPPGAASWYRWCPTLAETGTYRVSATWVPTSLRNDSVTYEVTHAGGTDIISGVNQELPPRDPADLDDMGPWYPLGTWDFNAGSAGCVLLRGTSTETAEADAIFFELQSSSPPTLPGDLNGDNCVDAADVDLFSAEFGMTGCTGCIGDLQGTDGDVDASDMKVIIDNYGSCL